ncbi:zinc finger protein ZAT8-like [Lolium rigidum]|uniref:zinc finger protein ZAT8-like n=1 Tax=Lolium rigidum TaxID=89674 RepID=UPI001F5C2847|nr:zinc finger protein ZAT8-like [Lolium rigidum]
MVSSMNHYRDQAPLSLSLSLGAVAERKKKLRRAAAGGGGESAAGEFACKTCGRSFPTFQALGGHRTSHLRGRHGLALALAGDHYSVKPKKTTSTDDQKPAAVHQCHVCGLTFEMGQALGGHMRRHREEAGVVAQAPPVLLQLFV